MKNPSRSTSLFERYKEWVRNNNTFLQLFETGASSLTWVLPDRFSDQEITLEAIHAAINLISAFHDTIINEPPAGAPSGAMELTFALAALQQAQVLVELWAIWAAQKGSISNRYDPLIAIEGFKSLVRLAILHKSGSRVVTNGGTSTFEQMSAAVGRGDAHTSEVFAAFATFRRRHCAEGPTRQERAKERAAILRQQQEAEDALQRRVVELENDSGSNTDVHQGKEGEEALGDGDGKKANSKSGVEEKQKYWWQVPPQRLQPQIPPGQSQPINNGTITPGTSNLPPRNTGASAAESLRALEAWANSRQIVSARMIIAAEILHILRPLIYVLALRRWGRRSWKSWTASLIVELASMRLSAVGAEGSQAAATAAAEHPAVRGTSLALLYSLQGMKWTHEEVDELMRRKLLLLYYLVRDPFFSRYTRPGVERVRGGLRRVPLVGWGVEKLVEVLVGAQRYYSYTSAS